MRGRVEMGLIHGEVKVSCGCTHRHGKPHVICKMHFALIEQNVLAEREANAVMLETLRSKRQQMKLHMGELTAQEMRVAGACLGLCAHLIRARTTG